MKRIFCPKCDNQLTFDDSRYPLGKILAFVCPQCGKQFKIKLGHKKNTSSSNDVLEIEVPDFTYGYITVLENSFGYKQDLPLQLGDNLIGRRNKDTTGVHVPIITSDPSMGRKHCVIFVKETGEKKYSYTLRDYSSITGTFLSNNILGKNEQVQIEDGAIITIGATTFILHTADDDNEKTE
ncbi:FHA domain-containing protein [Parabacteroides sp. OttesenSCG-928-G07]|nr:FHA domain-containing protein [Parabacteroides sp. OttesenSCG-928-G07]